MTILTDLLLHIHSAPGLVCIACGDEDTGTRIFTTDVGAWNRELRSCSPTVRLRQDYSISDRDDPRTSALKDERFADPRKVRDKR